MWLLIWLKLVAGGGIEYYHLGNFYEELNCKKVMSEAKVLITDNNQSIDCIYVPITNIKD